MEQIFQVSKLSYAYHTLQGEIPALSNISFCVNQGEFLAIVGPSGCGKSTLLNLLAGLLTPESGKLLLFKEPLTSKLRSHIGYMLQDDQLFEWRSIYKNVILGLEIRHQLTTQTSQYASALLEKYGLQQFSQSRPSQLSGGMRQRAALVRTLVLKPDLLLLDEPFSALDYQTRLSVGNDIGSIIKKEKKTAILVTHDLSEAISLADRILILSRRPGTIQTIMTLSFPPDTSPMQRRSLNLFQTYFHQLWEELDHA